MTDNERFGFAKSMLMGPQDLHSKARAYTLAPSATPLLIWHR